MNPETNNKDELQFVKTQLELALEIIKKMIGEPEPKTARKNEKTYHDLKWEAEIRKKYCS